MSVLRQKIMPWLAILSAAVLVLCALFITIARNYEGDYDYLRTLVEVQFEKDLQQEVYIDQFDIDWRYILPRFILQNVQIGDTAQAESALLVNIASIDVDWLATLKKRRLNLDKVTLDGINVEVRRDAHGEIKINQTLLLHLLAGESRNYKISSLFAIDVSNLSVHWLDEPLALDYFFPSISVNVQPGSKFSKLYASVQLPLQIGKQLTVIANMDGPAKSWRDNDIELYIKADELKLHELAAHIRTNELSVPLNVSFESWGHLHKGAVSQLAGNLSVIEHEGLPEADYYKACHSQDHIRSVNGTFQWDRISNGWNLQLTDLNVRSKLNDWPHANMALTRQYMQDQVRSIIHIDYFESGAVCNTLAQFPSLRKHMDEWLGPYSARVELWDSTVFIDQVKQEIRHYGADVGDFRLFAENLQTSQRVDGLSGNLLLGDRGGQLRLNDGATVHLREPRFYAEQTIDAQLAGQLHWQQEDLGWRIWSDQLRVENKDLSLLNRFSLQLQGNQPYIDMQSVVERATPPAIAKYFPQHMKTIKTRKWLSQSLVSGKVDSAVSIVRGRLKGFPFGTKPGVLRFDASVSDAQLNYRPGWPQITDIDAIVSIRNDQLSAESDHARVLGSKLQNVQVKIDSFMRPVVSINGEAFGDANNLLNFIRQTRLVNFEKSIVGKMAVSGEASLRLEIDKPLSKKVQQPTRVEGDLRFAGSEINLPPTGLHLQDITGSVHFSRNGLAGKQLSARLFEQAVNISIQPTTNGASTLTLFGPLDTAQYLAQRFPQFGSIAQGVTDVQASVVIPPLLNMNERGSHDIAYQVHSDLRGVRIKLPKPFGKQSNQVQAFEVYRQANNDTVQVEFKNLVKLSLQKDLSGKFALERIQLGPGYTRNSYDRNAFISGAVDRIDLKEWWQYWKANSSTAMQSSAVTLMPSIHITANELAWEKSVFKDVNIRSNHNKDFFTFVIQSEANSGRVIIPVDYRKSDQPVELDFKRLTLPAKTNAKSSATPLSPKQVPLFVIRADHLQIGETAFDNVLIETQRVAEGIRFEPVRLSTQDAQLKGSGKWRQLPIIGIKTDFVIDASSIDVEDSLEALGFTSAIGKGDAKIKADLRWSGSPLDFNLRSCWADIDLSIWDGVIKKVDPGAGRFLALVNLGAIGRRLSLDFDDVTDDGFAFDSVIGKLSLRDSDLQIKDLTLLSPTADIVINGKTNVVEKTYDQNISVTPKLSGGLPVAGALLGGPIVGAAIIVADQISKSLGSDINKVSTVDYKLTGTWEHPHFEKLTKIEHNTTANENGSAYKTLPP